MPAPSSPGSVATPPALAARLAQEVPPAGPILDPACGEGELLLAAWRASDRTQAFAERLMGIEVDPERAVRARERLRRAIGGSAGRRAAQRILCADALLPESPWPRGAFVLANPPWVSLSGARRQALPEALVQRYREGYAAVSCGWPSLHGAFLERIARHVGATGAGASVLIPAPVLDRERYGPLRAAVARHARIASRELLAPDAFPGVSERAAWIRLAPLVRGQEAGCWESPEEPAEILRRLARFPSLPAECFGDIGVHTGNAAAELVERGHDGPGLPLRLGRDLEPYRLGEASARLRVDRLPLLGRTFRLAPLERYRKVSVLLRQTADRPLAALHVQPGFFRNSLLACWPPAALDPAFVIAVLNSPILAAWHRARFADARQRAFPQVKVQHLRALPFPFLERRTAPRLHDEVARQARAAADLPDAGDRAAALVAEAFGI
jgi:SAM-dependent methyltransferase